MIDDAIIRLLGQFLHRKTLLKDVRFIYSVDYNSMESPWALLGVHSLDPNSASVPY